MIRVSSGEIKKRIYLALKKEVEAISGLSKSSRDIISAISVLSNRKGKIIVTGVGKSAFIGMKMSATLTSLGNHAFFLHPVDALHGDSGMVSDGDAIIAISFSGESPEVLKVIRYIKKTFSVSIVAITGNKLSSLGKIANHNIVIKISEEGSPRNLAPMASTTASMAAGDLIAVGLVDPKKFKEQHFAKFHPGGNLGLRLKKVKEVMLTGKSIPVVHEGVSLRRAILEISKKKKGAVGVFDRENRLVGVITDGDVRRFFSQNDSLSGVSVRDVMTRNPKIISSTNSLEEALKVMENYKITSLFVVSDKKRIEGIIHLHDIIEASS